MTPAEALRLSRAATLAEKHASAHTDKPTPVFMFSVEALAALIEDVAAPLRQQINDAHREADRDARAAYSEGQWDERESHRSDY